MKRPWQIAAVFGLSAAVVLAALGWASAQVLRLDRLQAEGAQQAEQEGNIRLALWRMESALAPVVAQEAARPYFAYTSFYPAERAYTRMFSRLDPGEVLLPSPMLVQGGPYVILNFQVGPDGEVTAPQAPAGGMRGLAAMGYTTVQAMDRAAARLAELKTRLAGAPLAAALPKPEEGPTLAATLLLPDNQLWLQANGKNPAPGNKQGLNLMAGNNGNSLAMTQEERNNYEFQMRYRQNTIMNGTQIAQANINRGNVQLGNVREGMMQALWLGDSLVLARRVTVSGHEYVQGAWLDWEALHGWLLQEVRDVLPDADLVPERGPLDADAPARVLANLPLRLVPGLMPAAMPAGLSPLALSLLAAWVGVGLAAAAVAVLLWKAVALSERRAAFVGAVTHELRTPLTTFRMYSEMLAGDMVSDATKRRRYLDTLRAEADRLTHLVENVLYYARLERKPLRDRLEAIRVEDLIERTRRRLADRATQAGMELVIEMPDTVQDAAVLADASAVEQVLFNLVDNACKYAARAADRRIHLAAERIPGGAVVRVCDHGLGIEPADGRRLFRPFTKSARDAANSAPGVGLGLALSRRLAREMGGDLALEPGPHDGACFVLRLVSPR
jgi:signal transduction histidine kinase